jgi:transcriptional regulator with PAS, ATPase and Fis domain
MSDITLSIELLNGEQLHGMLDLVQQALITIRYHSVEITINSNLMRLIKVATTKANSVKLIEKVLKKHGGNRKAAAAELGISERTLYRKIKQLG